MNQVSAATGLGDMVTSARREVMDSAGAAIHALAEVASELDMRETMAKLSQAEQQLASDTLDVLVAGRFRTGKSTLINALLGQTLHRVPELKPGQGPMPVDSIPCTAVLTRVCYTDQPYVKAVRIDGRTEMWTLARYLTDAVVGGDEAAAAARLAHIREFELGFPVELCKAGIILIDSPGLEDMPERTATTHDALRTCDAAIVVFRSDQMADEGERMLGREMLKSGIKVFWLVNMFYDDQDDDRKPALAWDRIVTQMQGGEKYCGQDLASQNIYLVQARDAQKGKAVGDASLVVRSGITVFEQKLAEFLIHERYAIKLKRHADEAAVLAGRIEQQIEQRRAAINADVSKLQQEYERITPQLAVIRGRVDRLSPLFEQHCREAQDALKESFAGMIATLKKELPVALKEAKPASEEPGASTHSSGLQERVQKLSEGLATASKTLITERVQAWQETEAIEILRPIMTELYERIKSEVDAIEDEFGRVHLELTGWSLSTQQTESTAPLRERIAFGLREVGGSAAAVGVGGVMISAWAAPIVGIISVIFHPIVIPAAIGTGLVVAFGGGAFLYATGDVYLERIIRQRVKRGILHALDDVPTQAASAIDDAVAKQFNALKKEMVKEVRDILAEEERNIAQMLELNRRDQAAKAHTQSVLDQLWIQVVAEQTKLKNSSVTA